MWRSSVDAETGRVSVCWCGLSARTAVTTSIGMLRFLADRSEGAGYVLGVSERTVGPLYSTGTLPLLRVWRIQIKKVAGLLSA